MTKTKLDLAEIQYGKLSDQQKGIAVGCEEYFLQVEKTRKFWCLQLFDLNSDRVKRLTAPLTLLNIGDLRRLRGKPIRDALKRWSNVNDIVERILIVIDDSGTEAWSVEKEEETAESQFSSDVEFKAKDLLVDPAFFYKLGIVFEYGFMVKKIGRPRFVIGEERNKRLLGLLLIGASKLGMTSIIKVLGDIGTAKDTMLRMWLTLLPMKHVERSYITAASMRYSKAMKEADILYIPDSPELKGEKGRHFRFMRADDGGLISEYATRDLETGEMTTKIVEFPVKGIATTSNAVTGDVALESGMWTLITDGTKTLTKQVKEEKLKLRAGKRPLFPDEELEVWKCAFKMLIDDVPEKMPYIPFAESLISILESETSRSRRDPDKLCDLVSLVAWIRRFQKPLEEQDRANIVDLYFALQIGLDAITQTIGELDKKEQQIFSVVKKAVAEVVTTRYVADETGIPYKTCYRLLEKLIAKGFMLKEKTGGKNVYSTPSGKNPKELLILEGSSEHSPKQLMEFIFKSFDTFSPSHENGEYKKTTFVDPITGQNVTIHPPNHTVEISENNTVYFGEKVRTSNPSKETVSETENKPETLLPFEMRNGKEVD